MSKGSTALLEPESGSYSRPKGKKEKASPSPEEPKGKSPEKVDAEVSASVKKVLDKKKNPVAAEVKKQVDISIQRLRKEKPGLLEELKEGWQETLATLVFLIPMLYFIVATIVSEKEMKSMGPDLSENSPSTLRIDYSRPSGLTEEAEKDVIDNVVTPVITGVSTMIAETAFNQLAESEEGFISDEAEVEFTDRLADIFVDTLTDYLDRKVDQATAEAEKTETPPANGTQSE